MNTVNNLENTKTTLDYYNKNASLFTNDTVSVDFSILQNEFISLLSKKASILDLGCGSGRDSKYFRERGFDVTSVDGSEELCKIASNLIGQPVIHSTFQDYTPNKMYDGIWACSSLLHLSLDELYATIVNVTKYLRMNGIFYMSFKYGEFEGMRNERFFLDMNESRFHELISNIPDLSIMDMKITGDVRPGREHEKWLNVFLKKE